MTNSTSLSDFLNADLVSVQSEISSSKKLLEEMARLLCLPLTDIKEKNVYHALLEREKLGNTGIGNGVALPHSRFEHTETALIAIITLSEGIDYDSADRQAVDVAFGLLVPMEATSQHLNLLAEIAKIMSDSEKKSQLLDATSPQQVVALLTAWSSTI